MCILFIYNGYKDESSEYSLILISNRDEFYKRPTQNMAPWSEDPNIIGGRDLEAGCEGGTWLALSGVRRKIGVLLNLPRVSKDNAISRGKIVEDYIKSEVSIEEYTENLREYVDQCNKFVFIVVEFSDLKPTIHSYSNESDQLTVHEDIYLGFGNSLPDEPLTKVKAGKNKLKEICKEFNKVQQKEKLIEQLLLLLKSEERHLPDPELESRRPGIYEQLSSLFVSIPEFGYGTRTHTLILLTKTGCVDVIELTLQSPIDIENPHWHKTVYQFDI